MWPRLSSCQNNTSIRVRKPRHSNSLTELLALMPSPIFYLVDLYKLSIFQCPNLQWLWHRAIFLIPHRCLIHFTNGNMRRQGQNDSLTLNLLFSWPEGIKTFLPQLAATSYHLLFSTTNFSYTRCRSKRFVFIVALPTVSNSKFVSTTNQAFDNNPCYWFASSSSAFTHSHKP